MWGGEKCIQCLMLHHHLFQVYTQKFMALSLTLEMIRLLPVNPVTSFFISFLLSLSMWYTPRWLQGLAFSQLRNMSLWGARDSLLVNIWEARAESCVRCHLESILLQMGTGFLRDGNVAGSEKDFMAVEDISLESRGCI